MGGGDVNIKGPKFGYGGKGDDSDSDASIDVDGKIKKKGFGFNIKGPKFGFGHKNKGDLNVDASLDVNKPDIGGGIDLKGPEFGGKGGLDVDVDVVKPEFTHDVHVKAPHVGGGIDIKGPKFSGHKGDGSDSEDEDGKKKKKHGFNFKGPKFGFGGSKHKGDIDVDVDVDKPEIEGGIDIKGPKFSGRKGDDSDSEDEDGKKKKKHGFSLKGPKFGFGGKHKVDIDVDASIDVDKPDIDIKGPQFGGKGGIDIDASGSIGLDKPSLGKPRYKITTHTGDKFGAGTDAEVFITLVGDAGVSGQCALSGKKKSFERKKSDDFGISCPHVGKLSHIRIGHNNSGIGDGWYLGKVVVLDLDTNISYNFPCDRWLATDEDDGKTFRDLLVDVGVSDIGGDIDLNLKGPNLSVDLDKPHLGRDVNIKGPKFGFGGKGDDSDSDASIDVDGKKKKKGIGFNIKGPKFGFGHKNKGDLDVDASLDVNKR